MKGFGDLYKSKKKLIQNTKTSKIQIFNKAFQFHSQGNISEAAKYYQLLIDKGFSDERVFSNFGAILKDLGKLKDAESSYRKAIAINPNCANAHSNLGIILKDLGKLKDAESSYRKAIAINPNFANAHYNLGNILKDLGKLKDAEQSTRKAIEINPNFANAHYNLGNILKDLGKLKDAESSYRKVIKLNPNCEEAYSNLGVIFRDLDKLKEAEQSTRKAIELNPNFANAFLNLGNILKDLGKLKEAEQSTRKAIELNPNFVNAFLNLGNILRDLGNLKEAEQSTRKAIELNPNLADAYSNLGGILKEIGKLKESKKYSRKAIELNPNLAIAYYSLSLFKNFDASKMWRDKLFSKNLLNNNSKKDQVNIFFARANILHSELNFKESSKYLQQANNLKLKLNPNNVEYLLNKSRNLLFESNKEIVIEEGNTKFPESIFIIGMPRSGSTLLESILSMNNNVYDLGEKNSFEEAFLNWKTDPQKSTFEELYFKQTKTFVNEFRITTNKWLENYQYTGIICSLMPNAKIIHCFRNPLDNILSIYRANFAAGYQYSSSLVDCARVYLDQEELMRKYKRIFTEKIYDLNYDSLVTNPNLEIKSLIRWLGWKWDDKYLSPHLNPRSVLTASNIQVRSPINAKSIGGWEKYKEMLKPAMEIITQKDKYKDLKY